MPNKGSNDLNMFLKTRVVSLRAELDTKGSMPRIRQQVDLISKRLIDKPVKLRARLDYKLLDVSKDREMIRRNLDRFKPLKIKVQIDTGTANGDFNAQMQNMSKSVENFNSKLGNQAKKVEKNSGKVKKALTEMTNVPVAGTDVKNFNNIKRYTEQLERARQIMMSKLPSGEKGLFSSYEIKDAQGNLTSFIATLERANGVVDKVKYGFDEAKGSFEVIDRTTATNTEKHIQQAMQSLQKLEKDLLKTGNQAKSFREEYNKLMQRGYDGTLTKGSVDQFKASLESQKQSVNITRRENELLNTRKNLIKEANALLRDVPEQSKYAESVRKYKQELRTIPKDAFKTGEANTQLNKIKTSMRDIRTEYNQQSSSQAKLNAQREKAVKLAHDVRNIERQIGTQQSGALTARGVQEIEHLNKRISKTKELTEVNRLLERMTTKTNAIKRHRDEIQVMDRKQKVMLQVEKSVRRYFDAMGVGSEHAVTRLERIRAEFARTNADIRTMESTLNEFNRRTEKMTQLTTKNQQSSSLDPNRIGGLINNKDLDGLKNYIGEMEKANVQTANWVRTASGTTKIRAEFEGTSKTVRFMNYELDKAGKAIRVVGEGLTPNRRENLGIWEQLRIAMTRVPVWMGAMSAFYGSIRSVRAMSREILELDRVMTEFRRVASDKINLDYAFQSAITMARELGNEVHGVTQTLADFARTYGDFNERQLLAITRTATLMSNVSDMEVEHAGDTLISVSNAFGIVADETIRIVDSINEVDNNFAVSTQQIAEGLQRSASTARTFGVSMEENIGHITAISSVSMESGRIIGNSLKTIYSRITTLDDASSILESVGVNVRQIGENGETYVKPVTQILNELSEVWWDLTDSQRQNIAVTVAGRYQLSRFLGMMNNYDIALDATETAVTSHGSAMRENAEYMKSFEARINKMKVAFTEFSQAVGNALLSGAMMGLIEGLSSLAKFGENAVNKIGALPPIFFALSMLAGRMGAFNNLLVKITDFGLFMSSARARGMADGVNIFRAMGREAKGASTEIVNLGDKASSTSKRISGIGNSLKTFGLSFGISAVLGGLGILIEKIVKVRNEQRQLREEAETLKNNMVSGYRGYADQMEGVIDKYHELNEKRKSGAELSSTEQMELSEATAEIANVLPVATKYIDANGEAHLKTTDEIKRHVREVEALSRAERELEIAQFSKKLEEEADGYRKISQEIETTANRIEELNRRIREGEFKGGSADPDRGKYDPQHNSGYVGGHTSGGGIKGTPYGAMNQGEVVKYTLQEKDLREELLELSALQLMQESERTQQIQMHLRLAEEQTLAYFEVEGQLSKMNESQRSLLESAISVNDAVLRNHKDFGFEEIEHATVAMRDFGVSVGNTFIEIYDELERRAGGDPLKLADMQMQLDSFAQAIPEDLFKFETGKTAEDMDKMLKTIANVSEYVRLGHGDFDALRGILLSVNDATGKSILTNQEAGTIIHKLGRDFGNTALDVQAFEDEIYDAEEGLKDFNSTALESVDVVAELFGYNQEELTAISDMAGQLETLRNTYSDTYQDMPLYISLVQNIADVTGTSIEKAEEYAGVWGEVSKALLELDSTSGESLQKQVEGMEGISKKAKEAVLDIINNGEYVDAFNGSVLDSAKVVTSEQQKIFEKNAKELGISLEEYIVLHNALFDENFQLITRDPEEKTTIAKAVEETGYTVASVWDDTQKTMSTPIEVSAFDPFLTTLDLLFQEVGNVDDGFNAFRDNVNKPFGTDSFVDFRTNALPSITQSFETEVGIMQQSAGTIFDGIDFGKISVDLQETMLDLFKVVDDLRGKITDTKSLFEEMANLIKSGGIIDELIKINKEIDKASDSAELLASEIKKMSAKGNLEGIRKEIDDLKQSISDAKDEFNSFIGDMGNRDALKELIKITDDIESNLNDIVYSSLLAQEGLASLSNIPPINLQGHINALSALSDNTAQVQRESRILSVAYDILRTSLLTTLNSMRAFNTTVLTTSTSLQVMFANLSRASTSMTTTISRNFVSLSQSSVSSKDKVTNSLKDVVSSFAKTRAESTDHISAMVKSMRREFSEGLDDIVSLASGLPARIGRAIKNNMSFASSSMDAVAQDMVRRFKKELGIQSPSRVFEDLGGWVIKGLANGLTGTDLKNLGKNVFDDFGGGALSSFNDIKEFLQFGDIGLSPMFGGAFSKTSGFGTRFDPFTGQARTHQGTDYGASAGTPIPAQAGGTVIRSGYAGGLGNMVEVQGVNGMSYVYGHNSKNLVSVGSKVKKGQIIGLVGSTGRSTGPHVHYEIRKNGIPISPRGFATGGFIDKHMMAEVGEEGLEAIIPLVRSRRDRGLDLWLETGAKLGLDPEEIEALIPRRGSGGRSLGSGGSFGAMSGMGGDGEGGGGDSGSSGVMQESIYTGGVNLDGGYSFTAFKRAELYKPNNRERQIAGWEGSVTKLEGKMQRINELSLKYRDSLNDIIFYQNKILSNTRKELSSLERRNKNIEKQLKGLSNTSKHTEKQRDRYNKLQQEFDSNLSKINSLRGNIESLMNSVHEKSLQIFTNFIDEIVDKYDKAIAKIDSKVENIEFKISVMEYVEPDNLKGILNSQVDKAHELQVKQATVQNQINSLQKEYNKLQKKSSREGKYLKQQLDDAKKQLRDVTLAVLSAEKDVKDQRSKVAQDGIKLLRDYYGKMRDMAVSAIDTEIKVVQKSHDAKMKNYDEEIKRINELYNTKLKDFDREQSEEKYQEELHKKNKARTDLINKITLLSRDNSIEGRKRLADLEKQLVEANEDIAKFQNDKQKELLREQIETQRDSHIEGIENKKETELTEHERYLEQLEKEKEEVRKKYDDMIENERYWAEMHDEFVSGRFEGLMTELTDMNQMLEEMGQGTFNGLTESFSMFSEEAKAQIKELNKLSVDNIKLISESITANVKAVSEAKKLIESQGKTTKEAEKKATKVETPKKTTSSTSKSTSSSKTTTKKEPAKKATPKAKPIKVGNKAKVSAKNANAYMDSYGRQVKPWSAQAKAAGVKYGQSLYVVNMRSDYVALGKNKSVNSAIAWIKKKDLTGLDTGGYTGDWAGNDGKVALLHKKELVLSEKQTENYLDFAKLMDNMINPISGLGKNLFNTKNLSNVANNASTSYGDISINIYDADKKKSEDIADEIVKRLDKMGK